jgi:hypothetical protein
LAPGELVVCAPEIAGDWTIDRPYTTAALTSTRACFAATPEPDGLGRAKPRLRSGERRPSRIMDASLALASKAVRHDGRSLACSLLNMLALTPRA